MLRNKIYIVFVCSLIILSILCTNIYAFEPSSSVIYQGIDVSQWQDEIDFSGVEDDGIEIVYIKASEGTSYVDPYFEINYTKARQNGLKVGFYHYLIARTVEEAYDEAQFFASTISGKTPDCKLAMDFESFGSLSRTQINQIAEAFLSRVETLTDKEVVIYSDVTNARNIFNLSLASEYPLWVAEYGVNMPQDTNWDEWIGFQYTNKGEMDGINGYVDRDDFTEDIFLDEVSEIPENITKPNSTISNITYVVRRGDTLSSIALRFGTSVQTLVKLNIVDG